MADRITRERRSANMAAIKGGNTQPELAVRRLLHAMRVGYRLHAKALPGRPDIAMKGRRKIIFVHGCFWHRHEGCRFAYTPKSRTAFWKEKFAANVARDERNLVALKRLGWDVMTVWECEAVDANVLRDRIMSFLARTPDAPRRCSEAEQGTNRKKARAARRRRAAKSP